MSTALERFLDSDIPRQTPVCGEVDMRVCRVLAMAVVDHADVDTILAELTRSAEMFDAISIGGGAAHHSAADFVRQAIAFVHDEERLNRALRLALNGASIEEIEKEVA